MPPRNNLDIRPSEIVSVQSGGKTATVGQPAAIPIAITFLNPLLAKSQALIRGVARGGGQLPPLFPGTRKNA